MLNKAAPTANPNPAFIAVHRLTSTAFPSPLGRRIAGCVGRPQDGQNEAPAGRVAPQDGHGVAARVEVSTARVYRATLAADQAVRSSSGRSTRKGRFGGGGSPNTEASSVRATSTAAFVCGSMSLMEAARDSRCRPETSAPVS
jgi:hypothetical protein